MPTESRRKSLDAMRPAPLTRREREVVRLVARGAQNCEVAAQLYVSPETVRSHVRNAMRKTNTRTRAHLVATAILEGLLED